MQYEYVGSELELFAEAHNWKKYYSKFIIPYIQGTVLEVGAGIGATTKVLINEKVNKWTCLEPDAKLCTQLINEIQSNNLPGYCNVITGTASDLPAGSSFHAATYIDVLEHIENDKKEINNIIKYLHPLGYLIILSPSYQFLYSEFDKQIGHFRRYNKRTLANLMPSDLRLVSIKYLDSISILTNILNKVILKQQIPTLNQIKVWDKILIPISKVIDPIIRYSAGKSVLGIWQKV